MVCSLYFFSLAVSKSLSSAFSLSPRCQLAFPCLQLFVFLSFPVLGGAREAKIKVGEKCSVGVSLGLQGMGKGGRRWESEIFCCLFFCVFVVVSRLPFLEFEMYDLN
jgi:hypothetical protein